MDFPHSRHFQRYEYIAEREFTRDKTVMDVGAGSGYGSRILCSIAKRVYAVDPKIVSRQVFSTNVIPVPDSIYDITVKVDICVAIEVFEHMQDPRGFVKKISELCEYAFFTTPLAKRTGETRNQEHIKEYSKEDFIEIVGEQFEIIERVCQKSDLTIVPDAEPNGDSFKKGHVVQMVWCRSKNGK